MTRCAGKTQTAAVTLCHRSSAGTQVIIEAALPVIAMKRLIACTLPRSRNSHVPRNPGHYYRFTDEILPSCCLRRLGTLGLPRAIHAAEKMVKKSAVECPAKGAQIRRDPFRPQHASAGLRAGLIRPHQSLPLLVAHSQSYRYADKEGLAPGLQHDAIHNLLGLQFHPVVGGCVIRHFHELASYSHPAGLRSQRLYV